MQLRHKPFVDVHLRHDWYRDGVCRSLEARPTPATNAVLCAHRLRLMSHPDGFSLVGPTEIDPARSPTARYPLEADARLVFALCVTDPVFAAFTELPSGPASSRWLLRNQGGKSALHHGAAVGQAEQVRLVGRSIRVNASTRAVGQDVTILDETKKRVQARARVPDFNGDAPHLDISVEGIGGVAWLCTPDASDVRLFIDAELPEFAPVAILELSPLGAVWPALHPLGTRRTTEPVQFTAHFRSRSVYWRYHIILPKNWSRNDELSIEYPQNPPPPYPPRDGLEFKPVVLPDAAARFCGRRVVSFESSRPLPLSEVALRNNCLKASHLGPLVPHLPAATCRTLARSDGSPAPFVSEIFVPL